MLNAQVAWQQAALGEVQARVARYADTVALFQALGGGWWHRKDADEVASSPRDASPLRARRQSCRSMSRPSSRATASGSENRARLMSLWKTSMR